MAAKGLNYTWKILTQMKDLNLGNILSKGFPAQISLFGEQGLKRESTLDFVYFQDFITEIYLEDFDGHSRTGENVWTKSEAKYFNYVEF